MYPFSLPNYEEDNIVNLMSSIANSFAKEHQYNKLKSLNSEDLNAYNNVVLIVVDGLGYNYLNNQRDSFLFKNLHSKLSSTFLTTTPCANTVFQVGYPPQQTALTGRTMNVKEVGGIAQVLPFTLRSGGKALSKKDFDIEEIMDIKSYHEGFNGKCFTIIEKKKSKRAFIKYVAKDTKIIATDTYKDTFIELKELINKKSKNRRFIHAYMDEFDSMLHLEGTKREKTSALFLDIDKKIKKLTESIKGTNTKLIIVSDHGMIDLSDKKEIWIEDIPGFKECLTIPLTGEPRVRDCFVRPSKVNDFLKIIETKMTEYCWCFPGEQLIKDNFYGLGTPNKKLFDRVGDYVLIMKENYVLRDRLINEHGINLQKAAHGALTDDELYVPLIIIDC